MPNGERFTPVSIGEETRGFLRPETVNNIHDINAGLNGPDAEKWEAWARQQGWEITESKNGRKFTQDGIPLNIVEGMEHEERDHFFGY